MWADSTLCSERWGNESFISFYLYLLYQIHLLGALFHTLPLQWMSKIMSLQLVWKLRQAVASQDALKHMWCVREWSRWINWFQNFPKFMASAVSGVTVSFPPKILSHAADMRFEIFLMLNLIKESQSRDTSLISELGSDPDSRKTCVGTCGANNCVQSCSLLIFPTNKELKILTFLEMFQARLDRLGATRFSGRCPCPRQQDGF